jgi:rubredoxin
MAKIIEISKAKPIHCACCGSIYEFESGDNVEVVEATIGFNTTIANKLLDCPNCGYANKIEFIKENN